MIWLIEGALNFIDASFAGWSFPGKLANKSLHTILTHLSLEVSLSKLSLSDRFAVLKIAAFIGSKIPLSSDSLNDNSV